MIRAVLDANVLVAGFATVAGLPAQLINRWRSGTFELVVSEYILGEVERAWSKPYWRTRFTPRQVAAAIGLLRMDATRTELIATVVGIAAHKEDDPVLATAVSADAVYLVTGDRALQDLRAYAGTRIVTPRQFLSLLDAPS